MNSPKTTLAGIAGGILLMLGPWAGARLSGDKTQPPITLHSFLTGAALASLGYLAKDKDSIK